LFLLWGFDGGEDQKLSGIFVWLDEELHKCHPLSGTAWAQEYQCRSNAHRPTVVKKGGKDAVRLWRDSWLGLLTSFRRK
jgi:hypothetical protein